MAQKIRVGSAAAASGKLRIGRRQKLTSAAKQGFAAKRAEVAEMSPWQIELSALFLADDDTLVPDDAALITDDCEIDESESPEPGDWIDDASSADHDEATVLGDLARPQPVLDLRKVYRLDAFQRSGRWQCRFREPVLTLTSVDEATHVHRLFAYMHVLADWLAEYAKEFLESPSAETWALAQGSSYVAYATNPVVTQQGFLGKVNVPKSLEIKKELFSRLLKDEKVWVTWRKHTAAPISIWFSREYRMEWALRGLLLWQQNANIGSVDWMEAEFDSAMIVGAAAGSDSMHDAFTRMARLSALDHALLRERLVKITNGRKA